MILVDSYLTALDAVMWRFASKRGQDVLALFDRKVWTFGGVHAIEVGDSEKFVKTSNLLD
ncbi:hypothetical protein L484_014921 [Morus notabilis]|uniref:Uncharacterized protein n=1 Tax=Morus notabilis TaxID=981085 RepID=W9QZE7_9ROSA|nr:hypothetical protein L484_014921 [Morus notabilis]